MTQHFFAAVGSVRPEGADAFFAEDERLPRSGVNGMIVFFGEKLF
jgi:hypothetical protein